MRCLASRVSLGRVIWVALALAGVIAGLVGLSRGSMAFAVPCALYAIYFVALAARFSVRVGVKRGTLAALLSAAVQGTYTFGVLRGLVLPQQPVAEGDVTLERVDLGVEAQRRRSCA